jgi:subtilase family serine protease
LPRGTRRAGALAAVCAAALAAGTSTAAAHPVVSSKSAPQRYLHTTTPPTTADCEASFGIACYSPNQFQQAYNEKPLFRKGENGRGHTIAIVDSFGSPTISQDLHRFDTDFHIAAPPSLQVITPAGTPPKFDPNDDDMFGWAFETTLDVEYAHAVAPGAKILLVETPVSETEGEQGFPEIVKAENFVIDHHMADVISQSFGATEETFKNQRSLLSFRTANENAGATA